MTIPLLPPKTEELVDDNKFPTLNWLAFFDNIATGDSGNSWTPTFVGLTEVGTATKTGKYWRLNKSLVYFRITITPSTSTTAVNGTTYCDNFPLIITNDGANLTVSTYTAAPAGTTSADKRIWTASWTAIASPIHIVGIAEVR